MTPQIINMLDIQHNCILAMLHKNVTQKGVEFTELLLRKNGEHMVECLRKMGWNI